MTSRGFCVRCLRSLRASAPLLAACLLASCIGGTGTDTENGVRDHENGLFEGFSGTAARVVDADGRPLAGVDMVLHTPGFRGDSGAPETLVLDTGRSLRSDSLGYARFQLLRPGKYVVEGRRDGAALFFDTLAVPDVGSLSIYTFRARPSLAVKGAVRLESGFRVESGTVFVRGTERFARLDSAGGFDLGLLPGDVGRLAVGLSYRAAAREARIAEQVVDPSKPISLHDTASPVYACREVSVDSAARLASRTQGSATLPPGSQDAGASADTARLDTARLAAVGRSCDSLAGGTVIVVQSRTVAAGVVTKPDSALARYIAVRSDALAADVPSSSTAGGGTTLVPLGGCVAAPGKTTTTYDVEFVGAAAGGGSLLVGDVADGCRR